MAAVQKKKSETKFEVKQMSEKAKQKNQKKNFTNIFTQQTSRRNIAERAHGGKMYESKMYESKIHEAKKKIPATKQLQPFPRISSQPVRLRNTHTFKQVASVVATFLYKRDYKTPVESLDLIAHIMARAYLGKEHPCVTRYCFCPEDGRWLLPSPFYRAVAPVCHSDSIRDILKRLEESCLCEGFVREEFLFEIEHKTETPFNGVVVTLPDDGHMGSRHTEDCDFWCEAKKAFLLPVVRIGEHGDEIFVNGMYAKFKSPKHLLSYVNTYLVQFFCQGKKEIEGLLETPIVPDKEADEFYRLICDLPVIHGQPIEWANSLELEKFYQHLCSDAKDINDHIMGKEHTRSRRRVLLYVLSEHRERQRKMEEMEDRKRQEEEEEMEDERYQERMERVLGRRGDD